MGLEINPRNSRPRDSPVTSAERRSPGGAMAQVRQMFYTPRWDETRTSQVRAPRDLRSSQEPASGFLVLAAVG